MNSSFSRYDRFNRSSPAMQNIFSRIHIDGPLLLMLVVIMIVALFVLYSASGRNIPHVFGQAGRYGLGFLFMILLAMVSPATLRRYAPWVFVIFLIPLVMLVVLPMIGIDKPFIVKVKGSYRWVNFLVFNFQPSEVYKIAVPMMIAWILAESRLPVRGLQLLGSVVVIVVPAALVIMQPDLGTGIMIIAAGIIALFLAGLSWITIGATLSVISISGGLLIYSAIQIPASELAKKRANEVTKPLLLKILHPYQIDRIKSAFSKEKDKDKKGTDWQRIQSDISIGSGGVQGKGYISGTQSLHGFLPEAHTDFIFAVVNEDFGLVGSLVLLMLYLLVLFRGLMIASAAQDTFSRLLAGTLVIMFMLNVVVNMLMVAGALPVVGIPLPLLSYGGTSVVTLLAAFGMLMSIHTHRKLV